MNEQFNERSRIESILIYRFDPRSWNWNKFGSGSRNLGDLLYLMNGESALKASALQPPPGICFNRNYTRVVDTIETSGKMPPRNPTDKVHYIVHFRDWRLTHSVTLALDVTKIKWVLSGRVNSIIDVCWHSSLPSPFRAYPKENPVLLGREYLNRTNRPVDIFASEQNN